MNPENINIITSLIDKIPTILSIILPSTVSILTLIFTYKTGKRQNALNLITGGRIEWQETIRKELADFIGDALSYYIDVSLLASKSEQSKMDDINSEYSTRIGKIQAEGSRIILRLNPIENKKIIDIINEIIILNIPSEKSKSDIIKHFHEKRHKISELVSESHNMLKEEWEKIKIEAGHKKFKLKK
jgi:hypothetical protein